MCNNQISNNNHSMTVDQITEEKKYTFTQERDFIENLLHGRFNFFLVFFSLVIAGVLAAKTNKYLIPILSIGFAICLALSFTIHRSFIKLGIYLKELRKLKPPAYNFHHPVALSYDWIEGLPFYKRLFTVRWLLPFISYLCTVLLIVGLFLASMGYLKPNDYPNTKQVSCEKCDTPTKVVAAEKKENQKNI